MSRKSKYSIPPKSRNITFAPPVKGTVLYYEIFYKQRSYNNSQPWSAVLFVSLSEALEEAQVLHEAGNIVGIASRCAVLINGKMYSVNRMPVGRHAITGATVSMDDFDVFQKKLLTVNGAINGNQK